MHKKILMIINHTVFTEFFIELAKELQKNNIDVIFAVDSYYTYERYSLKTLSNFKIYNFEDKSSVAESSFDNWITYADYDRNKYFKYVKNNPGYWRNVNALLESFFTQIFLDEKIDAIFYENISNGFTKAAYLVGLRNNIPYLGLTSSRLPGYALFSSDDNYVAEKINKQMTINNFSQEEINFANNYIKNLMNIEPDYMKTNGLSSTSVFNKIFKKRKIEIIPLTLKFTFGKHNKSFQMGKPLLKSYYSNLREIKRALAIRKIKKLYVDMDTFESKNFYLYPLHYHPESSTSIQAQYYDEFNLIKNIAFSLKTNEYLVVKDHLSAQGYEGYNFYKKISELPNVFLAKPTENAKKIIKKSLGIFTLTSTVGYEALLLNKPVIAFGDVFYKKHPLVFNARSYHDIKDGLNFIAKNINLDYLDYNLKFVCAYKQTNFPVSLNYGLSIEEQKNVINTVLNELLREITNE